MGTNARNKLEVYPNMTKDILIIVTLSKLKSKWEEIFVELLSEAEMSDFR
jgi:hypothetical protein